MIVGLAVPASVALPAAYVTTAPAALVASTVTFACAATTGVMVSTVTLLPFVVVLRVTALPAASVAAMPNAPTPCGSLEATLTLALQLVPAPLTVADRPSSVTLGVGIVSLEVKLTTTLSPAAAAAGFALVLASDAVGSVGAIVSMVTVNAVEDSPVLPAASVAVAVSEWVTLAPKVGVVIVQLPPVAVAEPI